MCHTDTLVHPIADEDNAIALIRFESGAIGQFEVSWTFRGGMDLRDEVAGTHGTIWLNHFLRTGFEMFSAPAAAAATSPRRRRSSAGWLFPVGDEVSELGYVDMFSDMFRAMDDGPRPAGDVLRRLRRQRDHGRLPTGRRRAAAGSRSTLDWRGGATPRIASTPETFEGQVVIKREILPDGRHKLILKDPAIGRLHRPGRRRRLRSSLVRSGAPSGSTRSRRTVQDLGVSVALTVPPAARMPVIDRGTTRSGDRAVGAAGPDVQAGPAFDAHRPNRRTSSSAARCGPRRPGGRIRADVGVEPDRPRSARLTAKTVTRPSARSCTAVASTAPGVVEVDLELEHGRRVPSGHGEDVGRRLAPRRAAVDGADERDDVDQLGDAGDPDPVGVAEEVMSRQPTTRASVRSWVSSARAGGPRGSASAQRGDLASSMLGRGARRSTRRRSGRCVDGRAATPRSSSTIAADARRAAVSRSRRAGQVAVHGRLARPVE